LEFYTIALYVLGITAVIGLVVGVANDAINFLNSAIGARAASFKTIIMIAGVGVIVGVMMSGGMMEVARKSIFNPGMFEFSELIVIFVAVMFGNIILLDTFNTFGLPTSTTVAIVFGLFGSALAVSFLKIFESGAALDTIFTYINSGKVLVIIGAILLSIVMAFIFGSLAQFLTRLLFSFDYEKKFKKYGGLWAGAALTSLSFFLILKGSKNASFLTPEIKSYILNNLTIIIGISFVFWSAVMQLLISFTKVNVLKIIVMVGTFALALAFAANDLVNFIGAPMAGFNAYEFFESGKSMSLLEKKVPANMLILIGSGVVMVLTLAYNKKALSVAKTELSLSRQSEGYERFESNQIARAMVRIFISIVSSVKIIVPKSIQEFTHRQFDLSKYKPELDENGEAPNFDLLRASVILMVSSALISFATVLKLPLSTTYVTFIVAMAAALPDRAWGRESAVYRVSGVITVIGGWFITAFAASAIAMIIAGIIFSFKLGGLLFFVAVTIYLLIKSHKRHGRVEIEMKEKELSYKKRESTRENALDNIIGDTANFISNSNSTISSSVESLISEDLKQAKGNFKRANENLDLANKLNVDLIHTLKYDKGDEFDYTSHFVGVLSGTKDLSSSLVSLSKQIRKYIDNNHDPLEEDQKSGLLELNNDLKNLLEKSSFIMNEFKSTDYEDYLILKKAFLKRARRITKDQLKRIKKNNTKVRRSMLFLNIITEFENIATFNSEILESFNDLYNVEDFKLQNN
jgi:phosphate/sulfate permease